MKGKMKHKRADGGVVPKDLSPKSYTADSNVKKEAEERKDGGRVKKDGEKVEGKKTKMRLDRPGRKSGGRVGEGPLSEASKTDGPSDKQGC